MDLNELGKTLQTRRTVLGLTLRDLSNLTGISKTTLSQIERGEGNPTFEILQTIFEYLNLEMSVDIKQRNLET